ncbi:winged helix-turn-helix domain-containing protein [Methylocapsa palsarum]|nr:ModE family transcriptional regulator [Methylocapsa palsarum]
MAPTKRLPESASSPASVSIEIHWPNGGTFGPEELVLIDTIRKEQSIIGASRALGLSYRKCWLIADMLNRCFESPVIATFPGRRTAGAEITPFGERLVALYRSIGRHAAASSKKSLDELTSSLDWEFDPKARAAAAARDLA